MKEHFNFFQACKSAYRGNFLLKDTPQGFSPYKIIQSKYTGYSASSFISHNTKQIVICSAGVGLSNFADSWNDLRNLLWIKAESLSELSGQYNNTLQFTEEIAITYKDYTFHFLGHSMGAVLAELQGIKLIGHHFLKGDVISFDSIGSKRLAYKLYGQEHTIRTPITIYNLAPNTFNTGEQVTSPLIISNYSKDSDHLLSNFELLLREYTKEKYRNHSEDDVINNSAIRSLDKFRISTNFIPIDRDDYKKMLRGCSGYKWISEEFLDNCDEIIGFIWMEDIFYGEGMNLFQDLGKSMKQALEDGEKYYGTKNVPIFYEELQEAIATVRNNKNIEILDIGSGVGMAVWKELLSGGNVTALDIAYKDEEAKKAFEDYVSARVPHEIFRNKLTILNENMFSILSKDNSENKEKYDVINVQNVVHFYCPKEIEFIIDGIYDLLKPNGMAVVTTNSLYLRKMYLTDECIRIYEDYINEGAAFPGYISVSMKKEIDDGGHMYFDSDKICKKIELTNADKACSFKQEYYTQDEYLHLEETWNDFDIPSLQKLFNEEKFKIISTSYYGLTLGPGKIDDAEKSFSVSIQVQKKSNFDDIESVGESASTKPDHVEL